MTNFWKEKIKGRNSVKISIKMIAEEMITERKVAVALKKEVVATRKENLDKTTIMKTKKEGTITEMTTKKEEIMDIIINIIINLKKIRVIWHQRRPKRISQNYEKMIA